MKFSEQIKSHELTPNPPACAGGLGVSTCKVKSRQDGEFYWIKGIDSGYLNLSPFEALTLAITMQTTFSVPRNIIIGMPIKRKHKGIARTT